MAKISIAHTKSSRLPSQFNSPKMASWSSSTWCTETDRKVVQTPQGCQSCSQRPRHLSCFGGCVTQWRGSLYGMFPPHPSLSILMPYTGWLLSWSLLNLYVSSFSLWPLLRKWTGQSNGTFNHACYHSEQRQCGINLKGSCNTDVGEDDDSVVVQHLMFVFCSQLSRLHGSTWCIVWWLLRLKSLQELFTSLDGSTSQVDSHHEMKLYL